MFSYFYPRIDLGIDLGTANTLIFVKGKGVLLNQPSIVTFDHVQRDIIAVGAESRAMMGKVHPELSTVRPIRDGVIADFDMTSGMLKRFIRMVVGPHKIPRNVVISLPNGVTDVEKRAVCAAIADMDARKVFLLSQPIAAAIGAGLNVKDSAGHMIVDIGGGTTQVAVISNSGIVVGETIKVAGDELTDCVIRYLKAQRRFLVGDRTGEEIKCRAGSVLPVPDIENFLARGRDLTIGKPRAIDLTPEEVRMAIEPAAGAILKAILNVLEVTPAELTSDLIERGIHLTGGGALLKGLAQRISEETGLNVYVTDDPLSAVARGTGKVIENLKDHNKLFLRWG
jgi:rod shape-determining protein MreB